MKSYRLTFWTVFGIFLTIMVTVIVVANRRNSNSTGIDPSQIQKIRCASS